MLLTRRLVVGVRVSSAVMVRRLVAEVPAAPVHVAPVLHQPINYVYVLLVSLMMHLDGLLEGGAEVAIERGDVACLVEAQLKGFSHASERAFYFCELLVALVQLT